MSSKRERGKQRKALKNLAAANGIDNITNTVALVRKGDNDATLLLADGSLEESNGILYEQSGVLSTVFKLLKRCEDDTFVKVMLDIGGNLTTPKSWIRILIKAEAQEESCRLQIAQSIGPLVRCMCNDNTRLFFKSNKHWLDTIRAFVALIHNMILSGVSNLDKTEGKEMITLFQHEGLLTSIIHWGFWNEEYRPDIAKELETDEQISIVRLGKATVKRLIKVADKETEGGREGLELIGTTPIISEEYDPECSISLVVGLIRLTGIEGWSMDASKCLRLLVCDTGCRCVDKDVINELIDLGINTRDDKWAAHVAILLSFMICKENSKGTYCTNDTRVAFAIRDELIELCLTFIERFGLLESFNKEQDNLSTLFFSIEKIFKAIFWVGLHQKTAKAIRSKRCDIEQELVRLEQNTDITNNINCKKLLDMIRSILGMNGLYCCRCSKSLSRTEVKLCNGCGCMVYCSDVCQKEDWLSGHKLACGTSYTHEILGRFQGRIIPRIMPEDKREASKLKEMEINANMIQLKLFLDNSETILIQVKDLDIPLYDCVVKFDLRTCPVGVTTHKYTDHDNPELKRGFEDSRSKENITCIFISYMYDGSLAEGQPRILQMQRLFPHKWLTNGRRNDLITTENAH